MFGKEALINHAERLIMAVEKIKSEADYKTDWAELGRLDQLITNHLYQIEKQISFFRKGFVGVDLPYSGS